MKYLKIAFGLAVVAGLMAIVASPAMATARWVTCEKGSGKYTSNTCTTLGAGGWETKELAGTSTVTGSGEVEMEDSKATGGATAIKCKGSGTGWVANPKTGNGEGGTITVTASSCSFIKAGSCETSKTVTGKARNLPWGSRLVEGPRAESSGIGAVNANEVRAELVSGPRKEEGNGEPGWSVECTVGGILKITDTCERQGNTGSTNALRSTGEMEGKSETLTEAETKATCSVGGANAGAVRGTGVSKLSSGNALWILAPNLKT